MNNILNTFVIAAVIAITMSGCGTGSDSASMGTQSSVSQATLK